MVVIVFALTFALYHYSAFAYSAHLFSRKKPKAIGIVWVGIVNFSLLCVCNYKGVHEGIVMVGIALIFYVELLILQHHSATRGIFIVLNFILKIFSVRLIVLAVYALTLHVSIAEIILNVESNMICTSIAMLVEVVYVAAIQFFVTKQQINVLGSSVENMKWANCILGVIYIYLILNSVNLYTVEAYTPMPWLQIKIGICALLGFVMVVIYSSILSRLILFQNRTGELKKRMSVQQQERIELENMAYTDLNTGCYNRAYGMEYLKKIMAESKRNFSVVFFDLDGLKQVNDRLGHNAGDKYIQAVANILKNTFFVGVVARMGGDEFVVIMEDTNEFSAMKYAIQAFEATQMLSKSRDRGYNMSISYGVLEVNSKGAHTAEQILGAVDQRMYEFKNSKKKGRLKQ